MCFKKVLKKIPPIYALNARLKADRTISSYYALNEYYRTEAQKLGIVYREEDVLDLVKQRLALRGLSIRPVPRGMLRILYVGADEAQDTGGFLQSIEKFGQVYRFEGKNGQYGTHSGNKRENGQRLIELVERARRKGPLHVVLGQMWGFSMPWQVLDEMRSMGIITANVCMDDRHAFRGSFVDGEWTGTCGLIPGLDLALTTGPEVCLWYGVEGLPALFWPEASNPDIFHPMNIPKKHDVCFVGGNYGIRAKIVRTIKRRGINVECYGSGWPNGRIATKDVPALFASSKVVLGVGSIGHCTNFYSLKLRDFDATLSGSMYLTHANPDLNLLFEVGKEIVCYETPEECADKCEYFLSNEDEREDIAKAGLTRSLREHTWEARFEKLFQVLGLLEN